MSSDTGIVLVSKQGKDAAFKADALIRALTREGISARVATIPIDILWAMPNGLNMYDMKRPADAIASAKDGRLHAQLEVMQKKKADRCGFIIEWYEGEFERPIVGDGIHSWPRERFENLMQSLQEEGARIVNAAPGRLPQTVAALYTRSKNEKRGSWHAPNPHRNLKDRYFNKDYRAATEFLMGVTGFGEGKVNYLLDRYSIREILGITQEGLDAAVELWSNAKGIGPGTVKDARKFLEQDFSSPLLRSNNAT